MLDVVTFEGGFRHAICSRLRDWIGVLFESVNPPGLPSRVDVNIDDWVADGMHGEYLRLPAITWSGLAYLDAFPSDFVPRGSLHVMWKEQRDCTDVDKVAEVWQASWRACQ
jgi:hypothetical protein